MNLRLRWIQHGANLAVTGTGLVYLVMKFLLDPVDEWSVVNHPWQPTFQHLHVLFSPLLVFAFGLLFQIHVLARWQKKPTGRASGLALASSFLVMAASGYLLQISVGEGWRTAFSWMHLGSGLLWIVFTGLHLGVTLRLRRRRGALASLFRGLSDPERSV